MLPYFALALIAGNALSCLGADPPLIRREGVVNAGSQRPPSVGGQISAGSLISIHGIRFSDDVASLAVRLITKAGSSQLSINRADSRMLEAWIPLGAPLGPAQIVVQAGGLNSPPISFVLVKSALGLFSVNGNGWGPGKANISGDKPAKPGQIISLFATGVAPRQPVEVWVGGQVAKVLRAAEGPAHVVELSVQLPLGTPAGCFIPVYGRSPGSSMSNTVTIAVQRGAGACARSKDDILSAMQSGKSAVFVLSRTVSRSQGAGKDQIEDQAVAGFSDIAAENMTKSLLWMSPPAGTCTTYGTVLDTDTPDAASVTGLFLDALAGGSLDAGTGLSVDNGQEQLRMLSITGTRNIYQRILRSAIPTAPQRAIFSLAGGNFHITGTGGKDVGRFRVAIPAPEPFEWTNRAQFTSITRTKPLPFVWSGAAPNGKMAILLSAATTENNVAGLVFCVAPASAGRFQVSPELLAVLPSETVEARLIFWPASTAADGSVAGVSHVIPLSLFVHSAKFLLPR
ncbi:MAG: hypothetical protein ABI811_03710 [Acidobacteriota bacterium]